MKEMVEEVEAVEMAVVLVIAEEIVEVELISPEEEQEKTVMDVESCVN